MFRYLKQLENKDLSVHSMTLCLKMKIKNATTEMIPVTWKEFGNVHPFVSRTSVGHTATNKELYLFSEIHSDFGDVFPSKP
jgi:glycine dehydrogenase